LQPLASLFAAILVAFFYGVFWKPLLVCRKSLVRQFTNKWGQSFDCILCSN